MRSDGDAAPWPLLRGDALGAQRARPARRRDTSDSGEEEFSENAVGGFLRFKKGVRMRFSLLFECRRVAFKRRVRYVEGAFINSRMHI